MTEPDADSPATGGETTDAADEIRKTRSICFTDSEWLEVRVAAQRDDVPAAEFVRQRILAIVRGDTAPSLAALAPLIERTFHYSWALATHRCDELDGEGRGGETALVKEARELQNRLQKQSTGAGAEDDDNG